MTKKYSILYANTVTVDGVDYPEQSLGPVEIRAGAMKTIRLQLAQQEGWVNELIIKQLELGGITLQANAELLDSKVPYYLGSDVNGERPFDDSPNIAIDPFRVIQGTQIVDEHQALVILSTDYGYPFYNSDGVSQTNADKYLYLTIIPNETDEITYWEVAFTYTREIG